MSGRTQKARHRGALEAHREQVRLSSRAVVLTVVAAADAKPTADTVPTPNRQVSQKPAAARRPTAGCFYRGAPLTTVSLRVPPEVLLTKSGVALLVAGLLMECGLPPWPEYRA